MFLYHGDVIQFVAVIILVVGLISEIWFRFRNRDFHILKVAKAERNLSESKYLFEDFGQMERHPAYSRHGLSDRAFYDELQASHKKVNVSPLKIPDVVGSYINLLNGERVTTCIGEKRDKDVEHWILTGGSTVLCLEVPDSMTWASCMQRIADRSSNKPIQVHNFGRAGLKSVKINAFFPLFLSRYTSLTRIIVYFGVNDAGWIAGNRPSSRLSYLIDGTLDSLSTVSKLVAFLNLRLRSRRVCKASTEYAKKTMRKFSEYAAYFEAKKIKIDFILQPNVFCKIRPSNLELDLIKSAEPLRIAGMHAAYDTYLSCGDGLITSAIDVFSEIDETIYIDWCHVGVAGNELIAKRIWNITNQCLGSDVKTTTALRLMKNNKDTALRSRNIFKNKDETVYNYPLY